MWFVGRLLRWALFSLVCCSQSATLQCFDACIKRKVFQSIQLNFKKDYCMNMSWPFLLCKVEGLVFCFKYYTPSFDQTIHWYVLNNFVPSLWWVSDAIWLLSKCFKLVLWFVYFMSHAPPSSLQDFVNSIWNKKLRNIIKKNIYLKWGA